MLNIGIDLGGTNIAVGIVDEKGTILAQDSVPTKVGRPSQEIIRDMAVCARHTMEKNGIGMEQIKSVGVGIPGLADNKTGDVIYCVNLFWSQIPLKRELEALLKKPVYIDNDANVAALAEYMAGASKGTSSSVFLTLGTGVGSGIIINGKLWYGAHNVGGEIGHISLQMDGYHCNCGNDGCVDRYCSAGAITVMAQEEMKKTGNAELTALFEKNGMKISAREVFDLAKSGNSAALAVFERYTNCLSRTIDDIVAFLDPELVVLGGGVSKAGEFLVDAVRAKVPGLLLYKEMPFCDIKLAKLGSEAGIIGASFLQTVSES